jgi:hypothetical protein
MIKFNHRLFVQGLLAATALALSLLAESAVPAYAGCVNVVGANGASGQAGAPAKATATSTSPSAPSSCATATGGNGGTLGAGGAATSTATTTISTGSVSATAAASSTGGAGGPGAHFLSGDIGGAASSGATATNTNGSASATATARGGTGGNGVLPYWFFPGNGGGASATSSATGGGVGAVLSQATANGGAAGYGSKILNSIVVGGTATAAASAVSTGGGAVQADASAFGGAGYSRQPGSGGNASVSANAQNQNGGVTATASTSRGAFRYTPRGTSALSNAAVGPGSESLVTIGTGEAVSNAIRTPVSSTGLVIGVGAMSAASDGNDVAQSYEATSVFDFSTTKSEALDLNLLAYNVAFGGFDSLQLQVKVDGTTRLSEFFSGSTGLAAAETLFRGHSLSLGAIGAGRQSIEIDYSLGYNYNYPSFTYGGFGFTYNLVDPPPTAAIPEPSTWAMMLVGFTGLAFAGYRASRGTRCPHRRPTFGRRFG